MKTNTLRTTTINRPWLLIAFMLLTSAAAAQDATLRILKVDGTPLDSIGEAIPARLKIEVVPKDPAREFRIIKGEVILSRGIHRVATINGVRRNIDLSAWRSQSRSGDQIVFDYLIEESATGESFNYRFRYTIL